jgi:RNA polymerase sigma factor (sigma-70 family)
VLYRRCVDATVAFAIRRCATPEQVHDLVAAAWLEVIEASPRFDSARGPALPWILGVTANLANDLRRRQARERDALRRLAGRRALDGNDMVRLEEAIDASRLAPPLMEALRSMPAREREAFELVTFAGLGQQEAAEALEISPTAFRMRLGRARHKLRAVATTDDDMEVVAR